MALDLVVPDLLLPADAPATLREIRLPALEKWISRADVARSSARGAIAWLAGQYGLPSPPPVAAISLAGEHGARDGIWLRADPVHFRLDRDGATLHDASILGISREEAAALMAALQAHFAADGFEFTMARPDRWYMRVPQSEMPATTPLDEAVGRDIFGLLPRGGGRVNWRSALTEAQMVMGAHDVNSRRDAEGKPAVNSIWFWGEGALPASVDRKYASVCADDPFARGLGSLSGSRVGDVPSSVPAVEAPSTSGPTLAFLDGLVAPWNRGDAPAWETAARALEAAWFSQLGQAIERFGEVRLVLPSRAGTTIARVNSASRWRWFRPRRRLADA